MPRTRNSPTAIAWLTTGYLFGGFVAGMAGGILGGVPGRGHVIRNTLSGVFAVACMTLASIAWSRELGRRMGLDDLRRAGWAGALSFAPSALVVGLTLTWLEGVIVEQGRGPALPIHIVYGLLFVPGSFAVAAATAWILAAGLRRRGSERTRLALLTGCGAGGAFLGVYLFMELIGWRVGETGAAERATMIVVSAVGALAAAWTGGAALGRGLFRA